MSEQSTISVKNTTKIFNEGQPNQVVALKDINLEIKPHEFVSLIGPSGCGKSTLLRLVADLIKPTTGDITVNDKPAEKARIEQDYGFVFQAATLYEWCTVSKNVQLPLEMMGYSSAERESKAQEMLELVELGDFGNHYPWQLSGGMQQRVSIARALAFNPPILLMDEPFGKALSLAALRATTEETRNHQGRDLGVVRGRLLDSGKEAAFHPGDLPADPRTLLVAGAEGATDWPEGDYSAMRFRPAPNTLRPGAGPPHIRLDQAAEFLLADRLR